MLTPASKKFVDRSKADFGYGFIPDPMIRPYHAREVDTAYDRVLNDLLGAQIDLTDQRQKVVVSRRIVATREAAVTILQKRIDDLDPSRDADEIERLRRELVAASALRDAVKMDLESAIAEQSARVAIVQNRTMAATAARKQWEAAGPRGSHGALVRRATLLVMFSEETPDGAIQDILERNRLEVQSAIPEISFFVVRSLDDAQATFEAEATRLRALANSLRRSTWVESAVQDTVLRGDFIPGRSTPVARDWFNPKEPLVVDHHVQAWNFLDAMAPDTPVGILDQGFTPDRDIPVKQVCTEVLDLHGTLVAGVIGATFNNAIGTDGAAPHSAIVACSPPMVDCSDPLLPDTDLPYCDRRTAMSGFLDGLKTLFGSVSLVNASLGYHWSDIGVVARRDQDAKDLVSAQGKFVQKLLAVHPDALLVASAGDDAGEPAVWSSAFNWAGLAGGSANVIIADATDYRGQMLGISNSGGTIKAIGSNVLARFDPSTQDAQFCEATSGAAALVTSTIAMMKSLDSTSSLSVSAIKDCLGITNGAAPQLDAFAAVSRCVANPNLILGDLDKDGDVDDADFLQFRAVYRQIRDGVISARDAQFVREDLNGDTVIDERDLIVFSRARRLSQAELDSLKDRLTH